MLVSGRRFLGGSEALRQACVRCRRHRRGRGRPIGPLWPRVREGVRTEPVHGQGPKLKPVRLETGAVDKAHEPDCTPESFPDSLPVSWALLGPLTLAAVPAEVTTAAGLEIRRALDLKAGRSALIGLANEYISYATTPAEYAAQDYAGASTLWGPYEAPFLGCSLAGLKAVVTSGSTSTGGNRAAGVHARARRRRDDVSPGRGAGLAVRTGACRRTARGRG